MTTDHVRNRTLPAFFRHRKSRRRWCGQPTAGSPRSGSTSSAAAGRNGASCRGSCSSAPSSLEIDDLDCDEVLTDVEQERGRLHGTGPIFDLYTQIKAVEQVAQSADRWMTEEESRTVRALRRRSYVLFETERQRRGDPGADPSLATDQDAPTGGSTTRTSRACGPRSR
jgi:hypothetical protein